MIRKQVHPKFKSDELTLDHFVSHFDSEGETFGNQDRNALKLFRLNGALVNIKSFKVPNIINKIVYRFFRKSKAQRSYEFANRLTDLGIGTPQPIAYYEILKPLWFSKSYYISLQQDYDLTYRELTLDLHYPNHDSILRAFTRFTFDLHEKGVNFMDHSPGNTLIKEKKGQYHFYLVDLNRMEFKPMSFEDRIKNFSRLTIHKSIVETMSDEYAKLSGFDYNDIFDLMWNTTESFQQKFHRKRRLKKKLKFWKN